MTIAPPDREQTAERLLRTSAKHSHDPLTEIDWEAPLAEGRPFAPPHRASLYGTALWEELDEERRTELTRHETASVASVGIWFECLLIRVLVRHIYDQDPTTKHVQYALTEIGDETRHSVMFARMIDKFGCPAYGPDRVARLLGRSVVLVLRQISGLAGTLFVEEILDALQREAMADESLQPLVRQVSRIHVVEEARHIRYAKQELARQWTAAGPLARAYHRLVLGGAVYLATTRLVHPGAYAAVGLDPRRARRVAARNPHYRRTLAWAAGKVVAELGGLGMIKGPGRLLWRRAGLLPARSARPDGSAVAG